MSSAPRSLYLVPAPRPAADPLGEEESGVRAQPARDAQARAIVGQLEREASALVAGLEALRFTLRSVPGPEGRRMRRQAQALAHVRDGLIQVLAAAREVPRALRRGAALTDYLRGLATWAHATLEALAEGPGAGPAHQIGLAKHLYFEDLEHEIIRDLNRLASSSSGAEPLGEAARRLFLVARALDDLA